MPLCVVGGRTIDAEQAVGLLHWYSNRRAVRSEVDH